MPKLLLSGGVGQSWEWVTQVVPNESSHYEAIGKPLWSRARVAPVRRHRRRPHPRPLPRDLPRLQPDLRFFLERYVHRFISKDNDKLIRAAIEQSLARAR